MKRKTIVGSLVLLLLLLCIPSRVYGQHMDVSNEKLQEIMQGILDWKTQEGGELDDWYYFSMGRMGYDTDFTEYQEEKKQEIEKKYQSSSKLSANKATEWHRLSLALLATGADPSNIGTDGQGNPINLIADGTYDRGKEVSLGTQGINGWIWALVTVDAGHYEIPEDAADTRESMIAAILKNQFPDGGFSFGGSESEVDMTGMAVTALSSYYNIPLVKESIDKALTFLSSVQTADGDFQTGGIGTAESTVQVMVALESLSIDIESDSRFIKDGNTVLDGILKYQMADGGFAHAFEGADQGVNESNDMAGEQVLYALEALYRCRTGMNKLFDCTPEGVEKTAFPVDETKITELMAAQEDTAVQNTSKTVEEKETAGAQPEQHRDISGLVRMALVAVLVCLVVAVILHRKKRRKKD